MKLCVDNDWLRRQIGNDPIADAEAGRVIRRSADVVKAAEAAAQPQAVAVAGAPKREDAPLALLIHTESI